MPGRHFTTDLHPNDSMQVYFYALIFEIKTSCGNLCWLRKPAERALLFEGSRYFETIQIVSFIGTFVPGH